MNNCILEIEIFVSKIDDYTYAMNTSDGREFIALKNIYGHWFLYEGNNVDMLFELENKGILKHCGFGYTIDMCINSIPTIQIKAWFGDWTWVSYKNAKKFLMHLYNGMNCSETIKMKLLAKHIKGINPRILLRN